MNSSVQSPAFSVTFHYLPFKCKFFSQRFEFCSSKYHFVIKISTATLVVSAVVINEFINDVNLNFNLDN